MNQNSGRFKTEAVKAPGCPTKLLITNIYVGFSADFVIIAAR
ncbi:hypothetical protein CAter10_2257 [Collimonas arenae]|nr:hypothetical protein CAter10_2257 [Collimonas arenae]